MSPLVTRPSLPVPGTVAASMPDSAASLRTDGASGHPLPPAGAGAAAGLPQARAAAPAGLPRGSRLRSRGCRAGAFLDLAEQRADRDRLAILGGDLAEHAGGRRRHLDRHLVGFELDQRLVDRDGVARLLEPFADGRLGDRFAERGHADLSHWYRSPRHGRARPRPSAILCFASCRQDRMPGTRPGMTACELPQRVFEKLLELREMHRHLPDRGRGRRPAGRHSAARRCLAPIWLSTHSRKISTKTQAPMLRGSSWHQTISACLKRDSSSISALVGNG